MRFEVESAIGFTLIAEGFDVHVPKGYIYFAMAFSVGVELLNIRVRRNRESRMLHLQKKIRPLTDDLLTGENK